MNQFNIIILLLLGLLFFITKDRVRKVQLLAFTAICCTAINFPFKVPLVRGAMEWVSWCFIVSEYSNFKKFFYNSKAIGLKVIIFVTCIDCTIALLNTEYYNGLYGLLQLLKAALIGRYFILYYSYLGVDRRIDMARVVKSIYVSTLALTAVALLNFILGKNYFIEFVATVSDDIKMSAERYAEKDRFRVNATFANAFNYGYTCLVLLMIYSYARLKGLFPFNKCYIGIACSIFGIYTCNCRTMLLCTIFGALVFSLLYFRLQKTIKYICISGILMFLGIIITPGISQQFNKVTSVFLDDSSEIQGSSFSLRELQFERVLFWTQDNMIFGRGKGFFVNELGGGTLDRVDDDLHSLEGVYLGKILEEGIVGLIMYYIPIIIIFSWFWKRRDGKSITNSFGITCISVFVLFGLATGELGSFYPTFIFIGLLMAAYKYENKLIEMK